MKAEPHLHASHPASGAGSRMRLPKMALLLLGLLSLLVLTTAGCSASEAELLDTLKTTQDASARHKAAVGLARIHSTEATAELVGTAAGDTIAAQGLEALRDEYIALLTLPQKKELSEKTTTALLQTVDCLAAIEDATSVKALGALAAAPGAYLLEASLHAVKALGGLEGEEALKELITCITVPADRERAREVREAASTALQARPGAAPLLVEARTRSSEEAIRSTIDSTLAAMGDAAVDPVVEALAQGEWAAEVLRNIGMAAVPAVSEALESKEAAVRYRALGVLLRLWEGDPTQMQSYLVRPDLVPLLMEARSEAGWRDKRVDDVDAVLARIGEPALPALLERLGTAGWVEKVLVDTGVAAIPQLVTAAKSEDAARSDKAVSILVAIYRNHKEAAKPLLAVADLAPSFSRAYVRIPQTDGYPQLSFQTMSLAQLEAMVGVDSDFTSLAELLLAMGPPAASELIPLGASLLDNEARWTDQRAALPVYLLLRSFEPTVATSAIVQRVTEDADSRQQILFLAVKLGIAGSEAGLNEALMAHGNVEMAEDYLNCGSPELAAGAERWADRNGYYVEWTSTSGSPRTRWGAF